LILRKKIETPSTRKPIAREALEQSLAEAVRASHPEFESFTGVIVERIVPGRPGEANWGLKGVRYGKADRHRSGVILAHFVEEAQREFEVSD
jgi:hypothetical protein